MRAVIVAVALFVSGGSCGSDRDPQPGCYCFLECAGVVVAAGAAKDEGEPGLTTEEAEALCAETLTMYEAETGPCVDPRCDCDCGLGESPDGAAPAGR